MHPEHTPEATKTCTGCGELLPLSAFGRNKVSKDGFDGRCKRCRAVVKNRWATTTDKGRAYVIQQRLSANLRGGRSRCDCGAVIWAISTRCQSCAISDVAAQARAELVPPNPSGLCRCGCGKTTKRAEWTSRNHGYVKGEYKRFLLGHQRFWDGPEYLVNEQTGCWEWQRGKSRLGYGSTRPEFGTRLAHRVYYQRAHGPISQSLDLDHLCRNASCVNPAHLEPVTTKENVRRGLACKVTQEQAREIRALAPTTRHKVIAERYGMSVPGIRSIIYGQRHRD